MGQRERVLAAARTARSRLISVIVPLVSVLVIAALVAPSPARAGSQRTAAADPFSSPSCRATPAGFVSLPRDDAAHPDAAIDWWFWAGHLRTAAGHEYGFHLVFIAVSATLYSTPPMGIPAGGTRVDYAITDVTDHTYGWGSTAVPGRPAVIPDGFDLNAAGQRARGGGGNDTLHLAVGGDALDLSVTSLKPAILKFDHGLFRLDGPGAGHTYERQREAAGGTLTADGVAQSVSGWVDSTHDWYNTLAIPAFWNWLIVQTNDGQELMAWILRRARGGPLYAVTANITDAQCHTTFYGADAVSITPTATWTRPDGTGACTYPVAWDVRIGPARFHVQSFLPSQEIHPYPPAYREGDSTVSGDVTGRAYMELFGYCA